MSLSTPKPRKSRAVNQIENDVVSDRRQDPSNAMISNAVISNDWVPATQASPMHHAQPVRLARPLRLQWYLSPLKKIASISKAVWAMWAARSMT